MSGTMQLASRGALTGAPATVTTVAAVAILIFVASAAADHIINGIAIASVQWTGGLPVCSTCNTHTFNHTDDFACNYDNRGNWTNGVKTFLDPLPPHARIDYVSLVILGAFNCDPGSRDYLKIVTDINGVQVGTTVIHTMSPAYCYCGNCVDVAAVSQGPCDDWPIYNHGGSNTVEVLVLQNQMCLSEIFVVFNYTLKPPFASSLTPALGPVEGETTVVASGENFDNSTSLKCRFGAKQVSASFIRPNAVSCVAPTHSDTDFVIFEVHDSHFDYTTLLLKKLLLPFWNVAIPPLPLLAEAAKLLSSQPELRAAPDNSSSTENFTWGSAITSLQPPPLYYQYYENPDLKRVYPEAGGLDGDYKITIYLECSVNSQHVTCSFASNKTVVSKGRFLSDGNIECDVPAWGYVDTVVITVSLNGQQYTASSVPFHFKLSPIEITPLEWLIGGSSFVMLLGLLVLLAVWLRSRHHQDGYKRLREGFQEIDLREVTIEKVIGKGTFGEVFKATWRGAVIAVKQLPAQQLSDGFLREFHKEIMLMKSLRHPNVLLYLGHSLQPPNICLATEYMCRGSLYSILHNAGIPLDWELKLRMLYDAARGCLYLHSCKPPVVHRDLKSHNLLVNEFFQVKVCDFGLSTIVERGSSGTMTACGTPCWTAPEVLRHLRYTEKADVFSFGVVMWECLTRQDPYSGLPPFKVIFAVGNEGMRPTIPSGCPKLYRRLAVECWDECDTQRPSFDEIVVRLQSMLSGGFNSSSSMDMHENGFRSSSSPLLKPAVERPLPPSPADEKTALLNGRIGSPARSGTPSDPPSLEDFVSFLQDPSNMAVNIEHEASSGDELSYERYSSSM